MSCFNSSVVQFRVLFLLIKCNFQYVSIPVWYNLEQAAPYRQATPFWFQFQCGTIQSKFAKFADKESYVSIPVWYNLELVAFRERVGRICFNSSVVQFREIKNSRCSVLIKFQFQCGTIQRKDEILKARILNLFQFQCGTIQRNREGRYTQQYFVSIPVWYNLERITGVRHDFNAVFQFQCGTIQSPKITTMQIKLICFNSSVVQFRASAVDQPFSFHLFQFQCGTIQSIW